MVNKLKYKVVDILFLSDSSSMSINEWKISVDYANKAANNAISKLGALANQWRSSDNISLQGGCTHNMESFLTLKSEDEGTVEVLRENLLDYSIEGIQKRISIDMGRL